MNGNRNLEPPRQTGGRGKSAVPLAGCGLLWCWLLSPVRAQDALFDSISRTNSTASQPAPPNSGPAADHHLGPVQFTTGGYAGVSYDDNINASENPERDLISRVGTTLNFSWAATPQSDLQLGADLGYLHYQKYTDNSGFYVNPDSNLSYALTLDKVVFTLFDQLSYSRQVRTEAAIANEATQPQFNNNAGLQVAWNPDHWALLASYSHADFVANHANDYLNRASENFVTQAGWRFAAATQIGVEASDTLTAYQAAVQNNNQNLSAGAYVQWQARPSLQLSLHGGPVFYQAEASGSTSSPGVNSYYINATVSHQITDYLSQSLSLARSLQAGVSQGGGYYQQLTSGYTLAWALTQRISVGATATYEDGQQTLEQSFSIFSQTFLYLQNETYQRYGGGLQATWHCTDYLSVSLSYNHWLRDSDLSGRGYTDNVVVFQLSHAF